MSDILQSNFFVMTLLDLARDNFVKIFRKKQVTVTFAHNNLSVTYEKNKKTSLLSSFSFSLSENEDFSKNIMTVTCPDT
jgi:hypothetical protein